MKSKAEIVITEKIEQKIMLIRNKKVMLDRDLAVLYQVPTFRLNEQVKRNLKRFPADFMFKLSRREKKEVIANCDNLQDLKFSPALPYAFTEHGIAMLSSILNSDKAIEVNIQIMRTFGKLRELMLVHKDLRLKIEEMEKKYDQQFKLVFNAIRKLLEPPLPPPKTRLPIGFHAFNQTKGTRSHCHEKK
jgi:hypothetical protein